MQQQSQSLTPLGETQTFTDYLPKQRQQQTRSTEDEQKDRPKLLNHPPMVVARQPLDNIIRAIISNPDDYDDLVHHIGTAQKIRAEWTSYRQKMPDDLLAKFKRLLDACRENGYIAPRVEEGKMVFSQVLSRRRNYKQADQCTLCSCKLIDQSCNGKLKEINHQRMFVKCWEV